MKKPLTEKSLEDMFSCWKQIIDFKEIGTIFWLPKTDQLMRVQNFMDWMRLGSNTELIHLDCFLDAIEDVEQVQNIIHSQDSIGIVFSNAQRLFDPDMKSMVKQLLMLQRSYGFALLLHCESSPGEIEKTPVFVCQTAFQQHVIYQPLYEEKDVYAFMSYLEEKWTYRISHKDKQHIFNMCGGYLWLIKECVRQLVEHRDDKYTIQDVFHSSSFLWKVEQIWNAFTPSLRHEIVALNGAMEHYPDILTRFNIICSGGIPGCFTDIVQDASLEEVSGNIICNHVDVTHRFSIHERKLVCMFLNKEGVILARIDVAKAYWGNEYEEYYSDWALDQIISRLRKKIRSCGISKSVLRTIRGKGYIYGK